MDYPDRDTYELLYARYVGEHGQPIDDLLVYGGDLTGKCVLDLCGGAGDIAKAAKAKGAAKVVLMDRAPQMSNAKELYEVHGVESYHTDVDSYLRNVLIFDPYDVVFCRQAVNYWLNADNAKLISKMMNPGGLLVFNTFNKRPPELPTVREYVLDNKQYMEVFWCCPDQTVHHVQCCEGMEPHVTKFRYIGFMEFHKWLSPYFGYQHFSGPKSSTFVCRRA
jgi:2-polyprenyl-3-methyl-5-hydroxy-6-metoxy-1,4-benzoquinol methylase